MADEPNNSAVGESVSTSAEPVAAGVTESSTQAAPTTPGPVANPFKKPWDDFGKETEQTVAEEKPQEEVVKETPPAAAPVTKEKTDEEKDQPLEDQVLEELFADEKAKEGEPVSESPKTDEDIDNQDPAEMQKAQRNKTAQAYLARTEKYAQPLKDFRYDKATPAQVFEALEPMLGSDKITALKQAAAHSLVDTNPNATFQRAYAVARLAKDPHWKPNASEIPSLDDIVSGKLTAATAAPETALGANVDLSDLTKDLSAVIEWDWRNPEHDENFVDAREKALVTALRAVEAKAKTATAAEQQATQKLTELETQTQTQTQTDAQKAVSTGLNTKMKEYRSGVSEKLLPYIAKNTGLEVSNDDTPEIKAFKERKMELYRGTEYERANDQPSRFESFVENESSVKTEYETVATRVVDNLHKATIEDLKGNPAAARNHLDEAAADRVTLFTLLKVANDEFKAKHITPEIQLLGQAWTKRAETINPEGRPKELVSNAAPSTKPAQKTYRNAKDVWNSMVEESAQEDRLAATG